MKQFMTAMQSVDHAAPAHRAEAGFACAFSGSAMMTTCSALMLDAALAASIFVALLAQAALQVQVSLQGLGLISIILISLIGLLVLALVHLYSPKTRRHA